MNNIFDLSTVLRERANVSHRRVNYTTVAFIIAAVITAVIRLWLWL